MAKPRAWLAWSSGKDSAWALHTVRRQGQVDVVGLLTTVTETFGRVSMHGVRIELLEAQAAAAGLPLLVVPIPAPCPNEVYERAMAEALRQARRAGVTRMVFGDLLLEDIRTYRQQRLAGTGVEPMFPLWGRPTAELAGEMIDGGLLAYVTCLDPRKVPRKLAGHRFDRSFLAQLPPGTDPCAENGEFHTCVTQGPMFAQPIPVTVGEFVDRDGLVFADLLVDAAASAAAGAGDSHRVPRLLPLPVAAARGRPPGPFGNQPSGCDAKRGGGLGDPQARACTPAATRAKAVSA